MEGVCFERGAGLVADMAVVSCCCSEIGKTAGAVTAIGLGVVDVVDDCVVDVCKT